MAQSSCRVCVLGAESSVMWGGTLRPVVSRATRGKYVRFGTLRVRCAEGEGRLNPSIKKDLEKVVDTVVAGELSKPLTPYCRCWRSETFPLCDGSHVKHNKATGDNVGPLLLKK